MCVFITLCFLQEESRRQEESPPPVPDVAPFEAPDEDPEYEEPPLEIHHHMPEIQEIPEPEPVYEVRHGFKPQTVHAGLWTAVLKP